MRNGSIIQLVLLLVLFFVLPSLLKILGQYTLKSKGQQDKEEEEGERVEQQPHDAAPAYRDETRPDKPHQVEDRPMRISNEPIHPKWF